MLKRSTKLGLIGAVLAGGSVLALWACAPAPVAGGANNPNTNTNTTTQATDKGDVKVSFDLPARQTQSIRDLLTGVDLTLTGKNWTPALTKSFTAADLASNTATFTWTAVLAGEATIKAVAKAATGELATDTETINVVAGQTVYANLKLTLTDNAGGVSANITIEVVDPSSNVAAGIPTDSPQKTAQFIGSDSCMLCHPSIATVFKTTAHYKGPDNHSQRPSCAVCHATGTTYQASLYNSAVSGFDIINDVYNSATNSVWANQGCEACHGPGSKHATATNADRFKTITRVPDSAVTCAKCHSGVTYGYDFLTGKQATESAKAYPTGGQIAWRMTDRFTATGITEDYFMAGGTHARPRMGNQGALLDQVGGYTKGVAVDFTNAHKTQVKNGCVGCHMAGVGPNKHSFMIDPASSSAIVSSCQTCHGTGFNDNSIVNFQAQYKMAQNKLKDALAAFRKEFCTEVMKGSGSSATKSVAIADIGDANLGNTPSLWDDQATDSYLTGATVSATTNWIDKANWTDGNNHWSNHQKIYNRNYWNYRLLSSDGSYGIHAPTYSQKLLRDSYNELVQEIYDRNKPASASFSLMSVK